MTSPARRMLETLMAVEKTLRLASDAEINERLLVLMIECHEYTITDIIDLLGVPRVRADDSPDGQRVFAVFGAVRDLLAESKLVSVYRFHGTECTQAEAERCRLVDPRAVEVLLVKPMNRYKD